MAGRLGSGPALGPLLAVEVMLLMSGERPRFRRGTFERMPAEVAQLVVDRVVQGMHAGVAPEAVEAVAHRGRPCAATRLKSTLSLSVCFWPKASQSLCTLTPGRAARGRGARCAVPGSW